MTLVDAIGAVLIALAAGVEAEQEAGDEVLA